MDQIENTPTNEPGKKSALPLIIIVVIIIAAIAVFIFTKSQDSNQTQNTQSTQNSTQSTEPVAESSLPEQEAEQTPEAKPGQLPGQAAVGANTLASPEVSMVKTFKVKGSNMKFDVTEIRVKKGDTVKIEFENIEGFHDWVIDEFNAKTKQLQAGKSETISFTADKTGTFEYYCSVGKHREMGMKGKLIVE